MNLLPSPRQLITQLPLSQSHRHFIAQNRQTIRDILNGYDRRLCIILGPCSIHDLAAACDYAKRLKILSDQMAPHFFLVMRTYFEKPRTTTGWKGLVYDPHLDGSHDMHAGLELTRSFLIELAEMGVPTATEFLDPLVAYYFSDLISWGCIGARTASSQIHRQLASSIPLPIGIKNSTEGSIDVAIQGILAASYSHAFMGLDLDGKPCIIRSTGNPDAHLVLRGGERGPNFDPGSLATAAARLERAGLPVRFIVDCSHDNSEKDHRNQPFVFQSLIKQVCDGNRNLRGLLLESHLFEGNQSISAKSNPMKYGVSITDPCMDWQMTENLITWAKGVLSPAVANNPMLLTV